MEREGSKREQIREKKGEKKGRKKSLTNNLFLFGILAKIYFDEFIPLTSFASNFNSQGN